MNAPQPETVQNLIVGAKVAGGGTATAWLSTYEPILAWAVGLLTAAVLIQTLWKNWKK